MIHWITLWQYDWCGHSREVHHLHKYLAILDLLISQYGGCYVIVCVLWSKYKLSSEHSMIICFHKTSLIMLSCHFRYFIVILLGFEKCNILLCRLQIRCILNVLMHVVNHLYRWRTGVGRGHMGNLAGDAMTGRVYLTVWHKLGPVCQIVPEPLQSKAANTIKA